jgi:hypothetical protein
MSQPIRSPLQINLLGPVEVRLAGADLTPTLSRKVKALLAYLAVEAERPHPRASLAGLLWPERPETVARQNLRQSLLRPAAKRSNSTRRVMSTLTWLSSRHSWPPGVATTMPPRRCAPNVPPA